jgi:hypothetical protein
VWPESYGAFGHQWIQSSFSFLPENKRLPAARHATQLNVDIQQLDDATPPTMGDRRTSILSMPLSRHERLHSNSRSGG